VLAALVAACSSGPAGTPPNTPVGPGAAPEQVDPYQVTWNPTLLESVGPEASPTPALSTLDERLSQAWDTPIPVTNGGRTVEVGSCRALLELDDAYEPVVLSDFNFYQSRKANCRAAALLARARPSKSSFVRAFSLDAEAPRRLPATLAWGMSQDYEQRIAEASAHGKSWNDIEAVRLLQQVSRDEARYDVDGARQTLTIEGRGDVDGDGIEDLVLLTQGSLTEGTLKRSKVFLLTRKSDGDQPLPELPLDLKPP